jgi:hypothetical protein
MAVDHRTRAKCVTQSRTRKAKRAGVSDEPGRTWWYRRRGLGSKLRSRCGARGQGWHRRHRKAQAGVMRAEPLAQSFQISAKTKETLPQACGYAVSARNIRYLHAHSSFACSCATSNPPSPAIVVTSLTIAPSCLSSISPSACCCRRLARIAVRMRLIESSRGVRCAIARGHQSLSMVDR